MMMYIMAGRPLHLRPPLGPSKSDDQKYLLKHNLSLWEKKKLLIHCYKFENFLAQFFENFNLVNAQIPFNKYNNNSLHIQKVNYQIIVQCRI